MLLRKWGLVTSMSVVVLVTRSQESERKAAKRKLGMEHDHCTTCDISVKATTFYVFLELCLLRRADIMRGLGS